MHEIRCNLGIFCLYFSLLIYIFVIILLRMGPQRILRQILIKAILTF